MGFTAAMRGPTSRAELGISWRYPTYVPEQTKPALADGETSAVQADRALELSAAFKAIAGDDKRPLLVLRECLTCTGTDDALMTRGADNEKTMLMSRWFHCVKLPPAVLDANNPFHNLFAGDDPAHLFVARIDGSGRLELNGEQSRTELWGKMEKLLSGEYKTKYKPVMRKLFGVLDKLDGVDGRIADIDGRMNDEIERNGPKSRRLKKFRSDLDKLTVERLKLRAQVAELSTLALRAKKTVQKTA